MSLLTKIKKYLFKDIIKSNLKRVNENILIKLYNLYDYAYLDDELKEISRELRVRRVNYMLVNNIDEFIHHFGDFKTANMWINEPWFLG